VVANFEEKKYSISVSVNPFGSGTVNITSGQYTEGATVELEATANTGFVFVNWMRGSTVLSTNAEYSHTKLSQAEEITANFESEAEPETYTLTVTVNPSGGGTTNESSVVHTVGQTIPLSATPHSDYNFVNWTRGATVLSTNASFNYTGGGSNQTVTANFVKKQFTVSVSAGT